MKNTREINNGKYFVPVNKKILLNIDEATKLSGVGRDKLIELSNYDGCDFVIMNGKKRLFKRKKLEEYLLDETQI